MAGVKPATSGRLRGRVAIVTGAGQGIGRAIADRFLREGAAVVLAEKNEVAGLDAERELARRGRVFFVPSDVACEESVRNLAAATLRHFRRLDILVNNAAIGRGAPPEDLPLADWNEVLAVNLTGPFLCARHAAPHLRRRGGVIINIASTRARMSEPHTEAYSASKGGVVALTHALALSLAPQVRVVCISPGWIETAAWRVRSERGDPALRPEDHAQHPAGRVGRPEDIAALAAWLASDEAGFVTGAEFVADGGMTRKMIYVE